MLCPSEWFVMVSAHLEASAGADVHVREGGMRGAAQEHCAVVVEARAADERL